MRYAIPTYQRAELLKEKTLKYLQESLVSPSDISIFVADEAEEERYALALEKLDAAWAERIFITAPGLCASRNLAQRSYLQPGEEVIWIDDDVEGIYRRRDSKKADKVSVLDVAEEGFGVCRTIGASLWGIYPSLNPFYMKQQVRAGLWHIVGCFYGQIIPEPGRDLIEVSYGDAKEDYERTLRHWERDGFVVRLDMFAPKTQFYRTNGGIGASRTPENVMTTIKLLQNRWPGKVSLNPKRKSGFPEILLKERG